MSVSKEFIENFSGQVASYESLPMLGKRADEEKKQKIADEEAEWKETDETKKDNSSKKLSQSGESDYHRHHGYGGEPLKDYRTDKANDQYQMP